MTVHCLRYGLTSPPSTVFGGPERRTAASYERELARHRRTESRLREALARAKALLRQKDELLRQQAVVSGLFARRTEAAKRVATLTPRQRQVMELVLAGQASKIIAAHLGISQRTIEHHRSVIMRKMGSKSLPVLTRLALGAAWNGVDGPFVQPLARLALGAARDAAEGPFVQRGFSRATKGQRAISDRAA